MGEDLKPGEEYANWKAPDIQSGDVSVKRKEIASKLRENNEEVPIKTLSEATEKDTDAATKRREELREKIAKGEFNLDSENQSNYTPTEGSSNVRIGEDGTIYR